MLNKLRGRINAESFREVNRRRRSRRGIRENFQRLSGPGWIAMTMVASLSKRHSGLIFLFLNSAITEVSFKKAGDRAISKSSPRLYHHLDTLYIEKEPGGNITG
ncbi:MAG: hypothetical protein GY935_10875 [Gammaproteobacteria bacterium]|nr:hypothetical protein [Gammaproteobacteria bacterium]